MYFRCKLCYYFYSTRSRPCSFRSPHRGGREGFCLRAMQILRFARNEKCVLRSKLNGTVLRPMLNGNCVPRSTEFVCFAQHSTEFVCFAQHSTEFVCFAQHSTEFVCFAQRASLNGNCVLRSTGIVSFAQRPSLQIVLFVQRKLCASLIVNFRFAQWTNLLTQMSFTQISAHWQMKFHSRFVLNFVYKSTLHCLYSKTSEERHFGTVASVLSSKVVLFEHWTKSKISYVTCRGIRHISWPVPIQ